MGYTIEKSERKRGAVTIKFMLKDDEFCFWDDEYLGTFSDTPTYRNGEIDRYAEDQYTATTKGYRIYQHENRYWTPAEPVEKIVKYWRVQGESKHQAWLKAQEQIRQELENAVDVMEGENSYQGGVVVKVYYKGIEVDESSVWGLDLSVYSSRNEEYLHETYFDVLYEAIGRSLKYAQDIESAPMVARFTRMNNAMKRLLDQRRKAAFRKQYTEKISAWRDYRKWSSDRNRFVSIMGYAPKIGD